ncbi:MAG: OmpA family protein [Mariprofundaceae bacterium]
MAKRDKKPEPIEPPKDIGAALFLELMMQMLAFFILLTSLAVIVEDKRMAALGSLAGTFSPLPKGANLSKGDGPAMPSREIVDGRRAPKRTAKELTDVAKMLGMEDSVNVLPLDKDKVRIRFSEKIIFAQGQVEITPTMKPLLDSMVAIFRRPEVIEIRIEGHTDDTPTRGALYQSNWELSAERAMSIFHAFSERGIANGIMIAAGMGGMHPIPDSPEMSRRVEVVLKFRPVTDNPDSQQARRSFKPKHRPAVAPPKDF